MLLAPLRKLFVVFWSSHGECFLFSFNGDFPFLLMVFKGIFPILSCPWWISEKWVCLKIPVYTQIAQSTTNHHVLTMSILFSPVCWLNPHVKSLFDHELPSSKLIVCHGKWPMKTHDLLTKMMMAITSYVSLPGGFVSKSGIPKLDGFHFLAFLGTPIFRQTQVINESQCLNANPRV